MENNNQTINPGFGKRNLIVVVILLALITIVITILLLGFSSSWRCENGQWKRVGFPLSGKPQGICEAGQSQNELDGYDEISPEMEQMARDADKPEVSGLEVTNIKDNNTVSSPLVVKGKARGIWFFEGEFQVKLMDGKGNFFAQGNAIAQGEWMTENWVPFEATLNFQKPATQEGFLLLVRNNPSGMPANDYSVFVPVKFGIN